MASASDFEDLPVELFELVVDRVDRKDLKALRAVSQDCAAKVLKTYKKVFFTELRVLLLTESSLRRAIGIIGHSAFGSSVRQLTLVDNAIRDPSIFRGIRKVESAEAKQVWRAQRELREDKVDCHLLRELLKTFATKLSTLHFTSYDDTTDGPRLGVARYPEDSGCFNTTMLALISSGVSTNTFSMSGDCGCAIPRFIYRSQDNKRSLLTDCLSRCDNIDLVITNSYFDGDRYSTDFDFANTMLASMAELKVRSLEFRLRSRCGYNFAYREAAVEALMQKTLPGLASLKLCNVALEWDHLVFFLKSQQSLRRLTLSNCIVGQAPRSFCNGTAACAELSRLNSTLIMVNESIRFQEGLILEGRW